jgi:transposase
LRRIGRIRVTDENEDKAIVETTEAHPNENIHQISKCLKRKHVEISERTVRRRLSEAVIYSLSPSYRPLLTDIHRKVRLKWANININRDWNSVIFSDETTFTLFPRVKRVWRRRGQVVIHQIARHHLKVHVWCCFSNNGFGKIFLFTGNLNAKKLTIIYSRALVPSAENWFGSDTTT